MINERMFESLLWALVSVQSARDHVDPADVLVAELWLETFVYENVQVNIDQLRRPPNYRDILAAVHAAADQVQH